MKLPNILRVFGRTSPENPVSTEVPDVRTGIHVQTEHLMHIPEPMTDRLITQLVTEHRFNRRGQAEFQSTYPTGEDVLSILHGRLPGEPWEKIAKAMNDYGYVMVKRGMALPPNSTNVHLRRYAKSDWWVGYYHRQDPRMASGSSQLTR